MNQSRPARGTPRDSVRSTSALNEGEELVSASFITPYPPGFPILVPGQVIDRQVIDFMRALDVSEIHGYRPDLGLRIFTAGALRQQALVPKEITR